MPNLVKALLAHGANPNAQIAHEEDFADSAEHCGVKYEALLQKILTLGMSYDPIR